MYEIDKKKFGAFVASLRKERGYTQQELADLLHISNKAVSKWETGVSIPDVTLLVPLSEVLGVSVTELLQCQRLAAPTPMDSMEVEALVKTAISYSEDAQPKRKIHRKYLGIYLLCLLIAGIEAAILYALGFVRLQMQEPFVVVLVLCSAFGLYFMGFAIDKLPAYYDENRIGAFHDGPVRINIPGVRISNNSWPHIVKVGRFWSMGMLTGYPLLALILNLIAQEMWLRYERFFALVFLLGGLFIPLIHVSRKYP